MEKVGEFERADVTATGTDFFLQIAHDTLELARCEAGAQELEPEPLTIIAQGELLAGELAIEAMDVLYGSDDEFVVRHRGLGFSEGDGGKPGQPVEGLLDMEGAEVSPITQSEPPKIEIEGFKMYPLDGRKGLHFKRRRAFGVGHVQRPQSESKRSNPGFTSERIE